ncbi:hypothetical protein GSU72_04825 [Rathayibacter sp. VKM Ac-2760]|nr:hypothetical protein GSU72_04825 [Rathayibacter sp. VKM Ac-2760]
MGALIRLTCEHLEQSAPRIDTDYGPLELRGRHAVLAGTRVALTPVALALFRTFVAAEGATVARTVLAAAAPLDDHAVDVAISRLRQALPEPRLVATVIKRGFRLSTPLQARAPPHGDPRRCRRARYRRYRFLLRLAARRAETRGRFVRARPAIRHFLLECGE